VDHAEAVEANNVWKTYFESIRKVCPWSLPAYQKDLIQIVHHLNYEPLGDLHARVYVCDLPPNRLKKISQKYNYDLDAEEWLWSSPRNGGKHSAPYPCLIQQDAKHLADIRKQHKPAI